MLIASLAACLVWTAAVAATTAPTEGIARWQAPLGQQHPLTGLIWDTESATFIDESTLLDRLVDVRFVVTGESHNNPDHHRLQLRILRAMFGNGRRVAVGLEIFTTSDQRALDDFAALLEPQEHELVDFLGWNMRHRRLWEQYRPLVTFAVESGLPLLAMNISRRETASVMQQGTDALPPELVERFDLDQPLDERQQATLQRDLARAHCGMLFSSNLEALMLVQRARDATMAHRLVATDAGGGALLMAGYGHARGDRGVPHLLDGLRRDGDLVSVLFASVKPEMTEANDYGQWFEEDTPPFDYVWFTPRVDDEDPCDRLRRIYRKDRKVSQPADSPDNGPARGATTAGATAPSEP
ncbi:MAG: ChaN family lipoprotein [Chromatiaceae bacterium]|nr:ChaN family lipoprotein [Gammaproteobacteria bacterium]MCP5312190.1 ChaN family lipoprotein [Chromatiaceae bacterium]